LQVHVAAELDKYRKDPNVVKRMKSPAQGAATSVWAAVENGWEGKGGKFLEDCQVSEPVAKDAWLGGPGYAEWAYNEENENKLWQASCELVGVKDE